MSADRQCFDSEVEGMDVRCSQKQYGVKLSKKQYAVINEYLNGDCESLDAMNAVRAKVLAAELPSNAKQYLNGREEITLYRGMTGGGDGWDGEIAMSWTTDYPMAETFADIQMGNGGTIITLTLTAAEFIGACIWAVESNERFEEWEVLMRPSVISEIVEEKGEFEEFDSICPDWWDEDEE
ncbi:MAG: hypothetical protein ACRCZ2_07800 [Fusobacteriaceae bacterium]